MGRNVVVVAVMLFAMTATAQPTVDKSDLELEKKFRADVERANPAAAEVFDQANVARSARNAQQALVGYRKTIELAPRVDRAQVAFPDYAAFAPQTTATLPTTFAFGNSRALPTHLEVYGTANAGVGPEIGDPWFSAAPTTTGGASFSGTFTMSHANETAVALGERYFWGVEQTHPADSAGIVWTGQSMVYPVTWH